MVTQYPHTVKVIIGAESVNDGNGNWIPGVPAEKQLKGRFETAGGDQQKPVVDGKQVDFAGIVYMPIPDEPIALGSAVEVVNYAGRVVAKGAVLQYAEGDVLRKNARLWL